MVSVLLAERRRSAGAPCADTAGVSGAFEAIQRLGVKSSDLVELFNDYGNVTAMAYVSDAVKAGHTFMLFANPRGVMGSLTTDYVDPTTTIPYYKGTWAGIRKIGDQADLARTVTFRPLDRSRPA